MPIDFRIEQPLSLSEAAAILPTKPNGKHIHPGTIQRWIYNGIRSRITKQPIKLEAAHVGRVLFTTREAIARFIELQNGLPSPVQNSLPAGERPQTTAQVAPAGQVPHARRPHTIAAHDERTAKGFAGVVQSRLGMEPFTRVRTPKKVKGERRRKAGAKTNDKETLKPVARTA